jgi:hypothetical protein
LICIVFVFPHRAVLAVLGGCVQKGASIAVGGEGAASIRICKNEGQKSEAISTLVARKFKLYDIRHFTWGVCAESYLLQGDGCTSKAINTLQIENSK